MDPWFNSLPVPAQIRIISFIKDKVDKHINVYEVQGYEKGIIDCLACAVQVLLEVYWKKADIYKIRKFTAEVSSLMDSQLHGAVTWKEMADYIENKTGCKVDLEWFGTDERPTPNKLFGR